QSSLESLYVALAKLDAQTSPLESVADVLPSEGWKCASRRNTAAGQIEEWVPDGTVLSAWRELVTIETRFNASAMPLRGLLQALERSLAARMVTGELRVDVPGSAG